MKRILSVDAFRGIAVFWMILWQIYDFLAKANIYSDFPYYFAEFQLPINGLGAAMFAFICGSALVLSEKKRVAKGLKRLDVLKHVTKRYGMLVLLSLLFTTLVFGFCIFYGWNEAIQGIGLSTIVTYVVLSLTKSKRVLVLVALVVAFGQWWVRLALPVENVSSYSVLCPIIPPLLELPLGLFLNAFFRGAFAVVHFLPIMIAGALIMDVLLEKKRDLRAAAGVSLLLVLVSCVFHLAGYKILYYTRTPSYILFSIGFSCLLLIALELAFNTRWTKVLKPTVTFGRIALYAYIGHFFLVYKPLQLAGLESSQSEPIAAIATVVLIAMIYFAGVYWLKRKHS